MLKKAYVEITNECNLRCAFCPGTKREKRFMTGAEFDRVLSRLEGRVTYLYLHLMGEPLLHPELDTLLALAAARGFRVCVTTNGTLLPEKAETLLRAPTLHKVSVSLHSFEGNAAQGQAVMSAEEERYLSSAWDFSLRAAARGVIVALRLWNSGGLEAHNAAILGFLRRKTGQSDWSEPRAGSFRLAQRIYLERAERFDWPDPLAGETGTQFCLALRDQLGVLCDGTLVPCCLDSEGTLSLGNLLDSPLEELLSSPRAVALREGFSRRAPSEPLCRRCGYAVRFNR